LNDKASGIYCTFYSIGEILAPNIGSLIYDSSDFPTTCEIMALMALIYSVAYFTFNVGFNVFKKQKEHELRMSSLKVQH
jgi:hypothetical protein